MNDTIKTTDKCQLKTYKSHSIVVAKAKGAHFWDINGNKYLDFYGGHAVALTGHCHPHVVNAIQTQAENCIFYSTYLYSDIRGNALKKLMNVAPSNIGKVFLCNSGTEANETAMKIARKYTGKEEIIAMKGSFHGRTIGSLSATGIDHYHGQFKPLLDQVKFASFGDIGDIKKKISDKTAAVILEPIQSMNGVLTATPDYFKQLFDLCEEFGCLLIFDEIQTGFGRTGKMFACQHWDIQPHLITFAKGVASGIPMGGVYVDKQIAQTINYGEHGCTFGGGQIACAAAKATLEVIEEEQLVMNAKKMGELLKEKLGKLSQIEEVKGFGLLLGLKLKSKCKPIIKKCMVKGVIFGGSCNPQVARLLPPLTINEKHVDELYMCLKEIWGE